MKATKNDRRQLENSIMRKQDLIIVAKDEIASSESKISKETRYEIEQELK